MATRQRRWTAKTRPKTPVATCSPVVRDLEWAAGFLEGEGCFAQVKAKNAVNHMVSACQKDKETLLRLQRLFGGGLTTRPTYLGYRMNVWQAYGTRTRNRYDTLSSLVKS